MSAKPAPKLPLADEFNQIMQAAFCPASMNPNGDRTAARLAWAEAVYAALQPHGIARGDERADLTCMFYAGYTVERAVAEIVANAKEAK